MKLTEKQKDDKIERLSILLEDRLEIIKQLSRTIDEYKEKAISDGYSLID